MLSELKEMARWTAGNDATRSEVTSRAYNVIDADGHILEPLDLWEKYIDPRFRDRAPKIVKGENGRERLVIEEHEVGISRIGAVGARQGVIETDTITYKDGKPGGFDPHKRIPDMDVDGIDAAFLYPSLGLFSGAIHDPQLAAATCRAYNCWLADYCSPYPDRLFGVAMLPMQDPQLAIEEMRFACRELGFKGGFVRPNPYHENHMMHHPMYEPFWAAAEDLDLSIGFHEGGSGGGGMPTVGVDRFEGHGARHIISHTMEMMLAAMAVIWGGVCERHPKIRSLSWSRAAAGSRRGSIAWTVISTTRGSTIPSSKPAPASCSGAIAGSRSSRSRAASRCWPIISDRKRSCGRPTTRTRTGFSRARRR